jgi:hypothetical protein
LAAVLVPSPAEAQRSVRQAAKELLTTGFIDENEIDSVATILSLQIATFPTGTSSGGFTLAPRRDGTGGVDRKKDSFGPAFAERASTLGAEGAFTIGVNVQATRFESFEGNGLRNGDLANTLVLGGRTIELYRYTFDVSTQTTSVFGNFAVFDNVDVGVIVPWVRASLSGTSSGLRLDTQDRIDKVVDVTSTGLGDIALRGKWNFYNAGPRNASGPPPSGAPQETSTFLDGGLAATLDIVLPTGSRERLSTAGRVRVKPMFVASADFNGFAPHVNIGYTFGGPGTVVRENAGIFVPDIISADAGDEFNYVVGAEAWPSRSLTVFADLIGRSLRDVARFDSGRRQADVPGVGTVEVATLVARSGTLNIRLASVGAKVQVLGSGLISMSLLFPLNEGGVKPGLTPIVGFEYTFGQ